MRSKFSLIIITFFLSTFSSIVLQHVQECIFAATPAEIKCYELKSQFSFPDEKKDEILIAYPTQLAIDEDGNIYICDHMGHNILKYSRSGKLLKIIGRKGQGPGEFIFPNALCYANAKLFITDVGNGRLQILDKKGAYLSSFKMINFPINIAIMKNEIFGITIPRFGNQKHLISVFNEKGRLLRKFGEFLSFVTNLTPSASEALIKAFGNKIYVLFQYYPVLRIYSLKGELIQQIEFNELNYKKLIPNNYDWSKFKKGKRAYPFTYLFTTFDVTEEGIFVGIYNENIIIDHYNFNGKFKNRFKRIHKQENFYLFDFKVFKQKNTNFKFYILNREGIPKIDVCTAKVE